MGGFTAERRNTVQRLDLALSEGRLSEDEHGARVADAHAANSPARLAKLVRDLPERLGDDGWDDRHRVRALDLHRAAMWLGDALATGALSPDEYRKRLTRVGGSVLYASLKRHLDGVPGPHGQDRARHFVTPADRERVGMRLEQARSDGRVSHRRHGELSRALWEVSRYGDLDLVTAGLAEPDTAVSAPAPGPEPVPVVSSRAGHRARAAVMVIAGLIVAVPLALVGLNAWNSRPDPAPAGPAGAVGLAVAWEAPWDRPADVRAVGTWLAGPVLVRARPDRLTGYDVATGNVSWTLQMTGGDRVCAMSREISQGIGLIATETSSSGCTAVVAVDLAGGRQLWRRTRVLREGYRSEALDDEVGLAASTAVVVETAGFVGVDGRGGAESWRRPAPAGCEPFGVAASGDDAVLLSACGDDAVDLTMVDAPRGTTRFSARLGRIRGIAGRDLNVRESTAVLSTTPLVVRTAADDEPVDAIVSFDDTGGRRATIRLAQPDHDLVADGVSGSQGFPARRPRTMAVVGDTVIATGRAAGETEIKRLAAYSLTDARLLWQTDSPTRIDTWTVADGRVAVLAGGNKLHVLAADTGRRISVADAEGLPRYWPMAGCELRVVGDRYAVTCDTGAADTRPALVLAP